MLRCSIRGNDVKVGICVDDWKLHIFRPRLTEAGFHYKDGGALTHNTTLLTVETENVDALKAVLEKATAECRKQS